MSRRKRTDRRQKVPRTGWIPAGPLLGAMVLAVGMGGLWLSFNLGALRQYFVARGLRNENRSEVLRLEDQRRALLSEKRQLDSWGFSAESAIRERFRLARRGENVILIDEAPPFSSDSSSPQSP